MATREFANIVYGLHTPYGWTMEYADVDNIHRDDLVNFYRRYYFPANVMLAVYGDFNTAEMKDKLAALFAGWTVEQPPVPKFPAVEKTPVPGVFVGTKTDVTQTFFEVGHLGGIASDKDFPALEVAGDILGGGFSSRLFRRVREQLGYAYEIYAGWQAQFDHPGLFEVGGSTQSKYTVQTIEAVRQEIEKMRTAEVTPKELQIAKDTVLNSFVFNFDRPSKTLNRVMLYKYFGYPDDFIFQYQKAVQAVTAADVLRVCREYFKPSQLTIVAIGNPANFGQPLTLLGMTVKPIDLTIPEPEKAPAAAVTAETREQGRALLDEMQKALGGTDKLVAIRDTSTRSVANVEEGGQQLKVQALEQFVAPSTLREEQTLPFGKIILFYNGQTGWISSPRGVQEAPPPMLKEMRGDLFREQFTLALSDRDPNRSVALAAPDTVAISSKSGESAELRVDPTTHLPAALLYEDTSEGAPVQAEEDLSDWREVSGVKVPFHVVVKHDGKPFADVTVEEAKINSGLTADALGQKPAAK